MKQLEHTRLMINDEVESSALRGAGLHSRNSSRIAGVRQDFTDTVGCEWALPDLDQWE